MTQMKLYHLCTGDLFRVPELPELGTCRLIGRDGFYGKVVALDENIHRQTCAVYDTCASFFCLAMATEIEQVRVAAD